MSETVTNSEGNNYFTLGARPGFLYLLDQNTQGTSGSNMQICQSWLRPLSFLFDGLFYIYTSTGSEHRLSFDTMLPAMLVILLK